MIEALLALFAHPVVPWALSAVIVAGAFGLWVVFRLRLEPVVAAVRRARAVVEEAEGPAAFRARFSRISRQLSEDPVLGEAWRAFVPTIRPVPGGSEALGYTRRPREQFDHALLVRAVDLRFYESVPNLLVGVGLLFTFLGLVAALHFASRGVAAADVQLAQLSLQELLAAATFKFATSIAGLGSSLVFSWRERAHVHRAQRELAGLCHALEARMVPLTTESLQLAQLELLEAQRRELGRIARLAGAELPEAAREELAAALARAVAPLAEAFAELAEKVRSEGSGLVREKLRAGRTPQAAVGPVGGGGGEGGEASLLRELRAIRAALEARHVPAVVAPPTPAPDGGSKAEDGDARHASGRLGGLLSGVRALLDRLSRDRGLRLETRAELRHLAERLERQLAEARRVVHRIRGEQPAAAADLARVEAELASTRAALHELTGRLSSGGEGVR